MEKKKRTFSHQQKKQKKNRFFGLVNSRPRCKTVQVRQRSSCHLLARCLRFFEKDWRKKSHFSQASTGETMEINEVFSKFHQAEALSCLTQVEFNVDPMSLRLKVNWPRLDPKKFTKLLVVDIKKVAIHHPPRYSIKARV